MKIKASELDLLSHCPGMRQFRENKPIVPVPQIRDTRDGIRRHEAVARLIKGKPVDDYTDDEIADAKAAQKLLYDNFGKGEWRVEELDASRLLESNVIIDAYKIDESGVLTVVDFKFGRYNTRAELQLNAYADVLLDHYGPLVAGVKLGVIGVNFSTGDKVHVFRYDEANLHAVVEAVRADNPVLKSGKHCRICPARLSCPEYRDRHEWGLSALAALKSDLPDFNDLDQVGAALTEIDEWMSIAKDFKDSLGEIAKNAIRDGRRVHGWELAPGRKTRGHMDEEKSVAVARIFGIDPYEHKIKSIPKLEKEGMPVKSLTKEGAAAPQLRQVKINLINEV